MSLEDQITRVEERFRDHQSGPDPNIGKIRYMSRRVIEHHRLAVEGG